MKKQVAIPTPSPEEVEKYLTLWDSLDNYTAQESSLKKLFTKTCPLNADLDDVLIKVCSLNDFYSTNILSPFAVAKHIVALDIDKSLATDDLEIVNKIARVNMNAGKVRNFYSFATKYCSHHKPTVYPIFDSYVEKVLKHFRRFDKFAKFKNDDITDYAKYKNVLTQFSNYYNLRQFNVKEIDKYLWQLGKKYFPRKYKNKKSQ